MRENDKAEQRNIYQPDRVRTGFRYSDSQTFVQTHFQIGKYCVPALIMNDGQVLTEVAVIVQYLADQAPGKKLAPPAGTLERYRLQEWLNFISSELHKGCSPLFNPVLNDEAKAAFKSRLTQRIAFAANALKNKEYLMGTFTVADAYLFTVLRWTPRLDIDLSNWPVLKDYMERMAARPAVKAAMKEEGL